MLRMYNVMQVSVITCKMSLIRRSNPFSDASGSEQSGNPLDNWSEHLETVSLCH